MEDNFKEIKLPRDLYEALSKKMEKSSFNNLEEFIIYYLKQVADFEESDQLDGEEKEQIKEKLRSLGYLG
jgi:hypothetical protein